MFKRRVVFALRMEQSLRNDNIVHVRATRMNWLKKTASIHQRSSIVHRFPSWNIIAYVRNETRTRVSMTNLFEAGTFTPRRNFCNIVGMVSRNYFDLCGEKAH